MKYSNSITVFLCCMIILSSISIFWLKRQYGYVVYYMTNGKKFKGIKTITDTSITWNAPKEYYNYVDSLLKQNK